jgi:hypothetical protein
MSIRNRTWKTAKGEAREAWVVDYLGGGAPCQAEAAFIENPAARTPRG